MENSAFVSPHQRQLLIPNNAKRSLSFLTVYDAPYELLDVAIIHWLSPYCGLVWHRWDMYRDSVCGGVFNGLAIIGFALKMQFRVTSILANL